MWWWWKRTLARNHKHPSSITTLLSAALLFRISSNRLNSTMESNGGDRSPAVEFSRPVGGTEYSWCRAAVGGTGTTVLALLLSRPIQVQTLQTALRSLQITHPVLRGKVNYSNNGQQPLISVTQPFQTVSVTVSETPVPDLHAALEIALNSNLWSGEQVPVIHASVHDVNNGNKFAVAIVIHTGFCDRTSSVHILKDLLELVSSEDSEKKVCEGEEGVGAAVEDLVPSSETWKPFWARGKDLVGYTINGFRSAPLRFEEPGQLKASEVVRLVLDRERTTELLHACDKKDIKLHAVLTAAGLIAAHSSNNPESNQQETYAAITLVDCRKYLQPALQEHHIGFYHSAVMNMHAVQGDEDLWELAGRCQQAFTTSMKNKKHLTDMGDLNFLMCKAIDNPQLTNSSSLRTAIISVFEDPVIYESTEPHHCLGVEDHIGCASVHGVGPSVAVFETIRDGKLDCALVYPSPLHSRKQMEELSGHMKKLLTEGSQD